MIHARTAAADYLERFVGTFYTWGGDDPSGFDCSGLAIEWLKAVGLFPRKHDTTAAGLLGRFKEGEIQEDELEPMCLVFWLNDSGRAVHVETIWEPVNLAIGASGGGPTTRTREDAIRANAFVKMRPHDSRPGRRVFVDPFLAVEIQRREAQEV